MNIFRGAPRKSLILLSFLLSLAPSSGLSTPNACFYLVRKTCVVQNATVSSRHIEIFTLRGTVPTGLTFKPILLHGKAFYTLPSEKKAAKREAFFQALGAYLPKLKNITVVSALDSSQEGAKTATRVVTTTLFSSPTTPKTIAIKGYILHIFFKTMVSSTNTQILPSSADKMTPDILFGVKEIGQDFKNRLKALFPFLKM